MKYKTKYLGEIEIEEDKILTFEQGILGFENYKRYSILYQSEEENQIAWLQCLDQESLALPVIQPNLVMSNYNPIVEDGIIESLGQINNKSIAIFVTLTVPSDITKMTTNLKAPLIVNVTTRKGCQVIVENPDYKIKFPIYELLVMKNYVKGEVEC